VTIVGVRHRGGIVQSVASTFTPADLEYIGSNYVTLETACRGRRESVDDVRRLIADGRLPRASYELDNGTEMVPRDYFALLDDAGSIEALREHFLARYDAAGGSPSERDQEWEGYLSGLYGVCLHDVTPETIVRKETLVKDVDALLAAPQPEDDEWRRTLRASVDELDRLEREFAPDYDRGGRFPRPPTRDRLVHTPRERYPDVFAAANIAAVSS